jgi:molybdopterin-binding protein
LNGILGIFQVNAVGVSHFSRTDVGDRAKRTRLEPLVGVTILPLVGTTSWALRWEPDIESRFRVGTISMADLLLPPLAVLSVVAGLATLAMMVWLIAEWEVIVTAAITNEAVAELDLQEGMEAYAVIKASDVMIGVS